MPTYSVDAVKIFGKGVGERSQKVLSRAGYSGWTWLTFDRLTVTCLDSHPLPRSVPAPPRHATADGEVRPIHTAHSRWPGHP